MSHDVFISYSSKDKNIANAVCSILEQKKNRCWIAPRDIPAGENYGKSITIAMKKAKILVVVFSNNSNYSSGVLNEIELATKYKITILPFRIEEFEVSDEMEYYLSSRHWLDAISPPIEQHILKLSEAVSSLIELISTNSKREDRSREIEKSIDDNKGKDHEHQIQNNKDKEFRKIQLMEQTTNSEYSPSNDESVPDVKHNQSSKVNMQEETVNRASGFSNFGEMLLRVLSREESSKSNNSKLILKEKLELINTHKSIEENSIDSEEKKQSEFNLFCTAHKYIDNNILIEKTGSVLDSGEFGLNDFYGNNYEEAIAVITNEIKGIKLNEIADEKVRFKVKEGVSHFYSKKYKKSFAEFLLAAHSEDKNSMIIVSLMYKYGIGVTIDEYQSDRYLTKTRIDKLNFPTKEQNNKVYIAEMHTTDRTQNKFNNAIIKYEQKEFEAAFKLFLSCAHDGHIESMYQVGICYRDGRGVEQDNYQYKRYVMNAAKLGHKHANQIVFD